MYASYMHTYRVILKECQKLKHCENLNFHPNLVFSAVLGQELATNLSSTAYNATTITRRHQEKITPLMCFQALLGCQISNTASSPLSNVPNSVFWFVWSKISSIYKHLKTDSYSFIPPILLLTNRNTGFECSEALSEWSTSSSLPKPERT